MKDRLQILINSEQLSSSKFADRIGVQRSSISHILSGRNNPSMDFIQKVLKAFPHINSDWLLMGKGEMYNNMAQPTIFSQNNKDETIKTEDISGDKNIENERVLIKESSTLPPSDSNIKDKPGEPIEILSSGDKKNEKEDRDKKIHKIVIFYKDRTFVEYYPE